jgi:hypothetical protein
MPGRESDSLELVAPTSVPVDDETRRLLEQATRSAHEVGGEQQLRDVIRLFRGDSRGAAAAVADWPLGTIGWDLRQPAGSGGVGGQPA